MEHQHKYALSFTAKRNGEIESYTYHCQESECPNEFVTSPIALYGDIERPLMGVTERKNQTATYNVIHGKYYPRKR